MSELAVREVVGEEEEKWPLAEIERLNKNDRVGGGVGVARYLPIKGWCWKVEGLKDHKGEKGNELEKNNIKLPSTMN